jgi:predicted RNase H-like HicB family nuclease
MRVWDLITFKVETEREDDGRWLAEVLELPGVLAYGDSAQATVAKVQALALRVIAERLEHGEAGLTSSALRSTLRDHLAEHPRSPGAGGSSADWLDRQSANPVPIGHSRVKGGPTSSLRSMMVTRSAAYVWLASRSGRDSLQVTCEFNRPPNKPLQPTGCAGGSTPGR